MCAETLSSSNQDPVADYSRLYQYSPYYYFVPALIDYQLQNADGVVPPVIGPEQIPELPQIRDQKKN